MLLLIPQSPALLRKRHLCSVQGHRSHIKAQITTRCQESPRIQEKERSERERTNKRPLSTLSPANRDAKFLLLSESQPRDKCEAFFSLFRLGVNETCCDYSAL